jgi:hypothetical protein
MHIAVKLHNDPHLIAVEIHNVLINRHLPAKFQSVRLTIAEYAPRQTLSFGLLSPQFPRPI